MEQHQISDFFCTNGTYNLYKKGMIIGNIPIIMPFLYICEWIFFYQFSAFPGSL